MRKKYEKKFIINWGVFLTCVKRKIPMYLANQDFSEAKSESQILIKSNKRGLLMNEFNTLFIGKTVDEANRLLLNNNIKYNLYKVDKVHYCEESRNGCTCDIPGDNNIGYITVIVNNGVIRKIIALGYQ